MVKSERAWDRSVVARDRCRKSFFSSFHSLSYSSTVRWIELRIELGIDLRINNARRTVLARISGLVFFSFSLLFSLHLSDRLSLSLSSSPSPLRIHPRQRISDVLSHVRRVIADDRVSIRVLSPADEPSPISPFKRGVEGLDIIETSAKQIFPDGIVIPGSSCLYDLRDFFLVADTQLYKRLCPSVGPSVRPSVMIESKSGKTSILDTSCVGLSVGDGLGDGWGLAAPAHPSATIL